MKPLLLLPGSILALTLAHFRERALTPPADWIDPATGHRVIRLSGDGGGSSLYFHQNSFTPKGDKLIFDTRAGIAVVDLTKLGEEPIKPEVVVPEARAISTAWRTPDVCYRKSGALYATNLETKEARKVTTANGTVVNADETLVVGFASDSDAAAKVKELGLPMLVTTDLVNRNEPPGRLRPGNPRRRTTPGRRRTRCRVGSDASRAAILRHPTLGVRAAHRIGFGALARFRVGSPE